MITEFLSLLCLGLCLGNEDEEKNGNQEERKPASSQTDTRVVFVATFSCLSLFLLFLAIFFIYRCTQQDSSQEESTKRTCPWEVRKQRDADEHMLERISESNSVVHHTMEYYSAPKKDEALVHAMTWMTFGNIMLRHRKLCIIAFYLYEISRMDRSLERESGLMAAINGCH
ncbi:uncharacterized protein ACBT57_009994 isoform 1-T1 [Dama dama]|uniref:uncharacterized protein LOC133054857 isoform X1 n=1 Tax=Dama dama TaxID=30532 RepID=UPI002A367DB1|nr:uncharacterized protein LOC133054857 isoform X1 [Dama dama]